MKAVSIRIIKLKSQMEEISGPAAGLVDVLFGQQHRRAHAFAGANGTGCGQRRDTANLDRAFGGRRGCSQQRKPTRKGQGH